MRFSRKNINIIKQIWNKISEYETIVISRHVRPDGDAIGSSCGLARLLKDNFPSKKIYVINSDRSDILKKYEEEDENIPDSICKESLLIVTDTSDSERISNKKHKLFKEIIKIDHHPDTEPYGNINLVESFRSSTCEIIVKLWYFSNKKQILTKQTATLLYLGIITDTNRFLYKPDKECLMYSSILLSYGVETDELYDALYLKPYSYLNFQKYVLNLVHKTANGVTYVVLEEKDILLNSITNEEASECINFISNISDCPIYIGFIYDSLRKCYKVRLRSRNIDIRELAIKYNGGGHKFACGATVYNKEEINKLVNEADEILFKLKLDKDHS